MKILINGNELEFKLEDEKTAHQVAKAILNWASNQGRVVMGVEVDGKKYDIENDAETLKMLEVETITIINFHIESTKDLLLSTIYEAVNYSEKVIRYDLDKIEDKELENLKTGLKWCSEAFANCEVIIGVDYKTLTLENDTFSNVLKELQSLASQVNRQALEENPQLGLDIKSLMNRYVLFLEVIRKKYFAIDAETINVGEQLGTAIEFFEDYAQKTEEISTLLQTGKELEGLEKLAILVSYMENSIRVLTRIRMDGDIDIDGYQIEGVPFADFIQDFQKTLKEIITAFDNKDTVLLGDLFEYEIPGKVSALNGLLKEIEPLLKEKA